MSHYELKHRIWMLISHRSSYHVFCEWSLIPCGLLDFLKWNKELRLPYLKRSFSLSSPRVFYLKAMQYRDLKQGICFVVFQFFPYFN